MATTVSIPGGANGAPLIFKVTGTSASNFATAFQNAVGGDTVVNLTNDAPQVSGPSVLNEIFSNGASSYALQFGGQHTLVDVGFATTVTGSTAGMDTVLATGATTYDATGNDNQVTFIDGTNSYVGGTATGDTITGGAGYDTISTGTGFSTVFSGSGNTLIDLNDTVAGSSTAPGGLAYLGDGHATVVANGLNDDVVAASNGQTIFGGTDTASTLNVAIEDNATSSGPAGDVVTAGAGTTNVFDSVGGNSIFGGSGTLRFVGGTPASAGSVISDSVYGGDGGAFIFGASGDSVSFSGDTIGSTGVFIAGTGNETLNAANAEGRVNFYGSSDSTSSEQLVGSTTGFNYFVTGGNGDTVTGTSTVAGTGGSESLVGGTGTNIFAVADGGATSHITIFDFAAGNDSVNFFGQNASQVQTDLNGATVNSTGLTVTLSDNTTVTFVGLTSISQLHVTGTGT